MTLEEIQAELSAAFVDDLSAQDGGYLQASIDLSLRYPKLFEAVTKIMEINCAEQEQTSANRRGSPAH